jgi:hypothetical protein
MSASPRSEMWSKTIRFRGYSVNDRLFEGGKKISFIREGRRNMPTWNEEERLKISWDDGTFLQRSSERTRVQVRGTETSARPMDDAFMIAGTTTGVTRTGKGFKKTITEPLHVSRDCRWIRQGIVSIAIRGESEAILDYGDGTCDNIATITRDGTTREIKLRRK